MQVWILGIQCEDENEGMNRPRNIFEGRVEVKQGRLVYTSFKRKGSIPPLPSTTG